MPPKAAFGPAKAGTPTAALVERVERLRAVQRESLRQAEHLFASLLAQEFKLESPLESRL